MPLNVCPPTRKPGAAFIAEALKHKTLSVRVSARTTRAKGRVNPFMQAALKKKRHARRHALINRQIWRFRRVPVRKHKRKIVRLMRTRVRTCANTNVRTCTYGAETARSSGPPRGTAHAPSPPVDRMALSCGVAPPSPPSGRLAPGLFRIRRGQTPRARLPTRRTSPAYTHARAFS